MIVILSVTHGEGMGAERVLLQLLQGVTASARSEFLVVAPGGSRVEVVARKLGCRSLQFRTSRDAAVANFLAATRLVPHLEGCRIVHAWTARAFELAWWIGQRRGIRRMGTLHDHPRASFHGALRRKLIRWMGSRLNRMVCVK